MHIDSLPHENIRFTYKDIDDISPYSHERVEELLRENKTFKVIQYIQSQNDSNLWYWALRYACEYGNHKIIQCALENDDRLDIGEGFTGACSGGDFELVKCIIDKSDKIDWNNGLANAIRGQHTNIAHFILENARKPLDHNYALRIAAYSGCVTIIGTLISVGADDWNSALYSAAIKNRYEIGILMIKKGARLPPKSRYRTEEVKRERVIKFMERILVRLLQ